MTGALVSFVGGEAAQTLAELHAQCFEPAWSAEELYSLMATPGTFAVMAGISAGAPPTGFAVARVAADEAEILSIGVVPESRGGGIARVLLEAALQGGRERGAVRVFLEVAADNAAARALYARAGFTPAGSRKGYYARAAGPAMDALVLKLAFEAP